ncbi:hypothetical protein GCM10009827_029080 [Dactylosporangium maewongense]|uniref:Uncharacterized protein n=1 Tax=Dactylosporangium maewongense TaxID=634393 RepID=A0ABN2A833_9ACTN
MGGAPTVVNARYIVRDGPWPGLSEIAQEEPHHAAIHGESVYRPDQTWTRVNRGVYAP